MPVAQALRYDARSLLLLEAEARRRGMHRGGQLSSVWTPNAGGQAEFLALDTLQAIATGDRGGGKTTLLLADFARDIGKHGPAWRGILFRQSFPQLDDVIVKSLALFRRAFPAARYNRGNHTWSWPGGEELLLRFIERPGDYWSYHGHEYPWIGFDELTTWPTLECFDLVKSLCRSSTMGVPRRIRATSNPWGKGHNVVKARFIDPDTGATWDDSPPQSDLARDLGIEIKPLPTRRVRVLLGENRPLMEADPNYRSNIAAAALSEGQLRAWIAEDWDVVSGGMFDDVWDRSVHVVAPFEIPAGWRLDRSFDWGSSKPYSIGWWAESDGTEAKMPDGSKRLWPRGTLFRVAELYGWTGEPNRGLRHTSTEVARRIVETERESPLLRGRSVAPGPADPSIWTKDDRGVAVADSMETCGVRWMKADASAGSRVNGWQLVRTRLAAAMERDGESARYRPRCLPMEEPGLFVFATCSQFLRTVPVAPRDERKPDDLDTESEDHVADEVRYRVAAAKAPAPMEVDRSLVAW